MSIELEADPRWHLVQRIVASPQFVRSVRLKSFLLYVAQCALLDHAEQVTEQQIGVHVFGRPAAYNAGDDNIVRSQARFLRTKLGEYFDSEPGQAEAMILTIPKGSYLPHFVARTESTPSQPVVLEPEPESLAPPPPPKPTHRVTIARRIWIAVAAVAALLLILVWARPHLPAANTQVPGSALWSRLFDANRQTTIVASDYVFSMVQEAAGHTLTLDEYLSADYFNRVAQLNTVSGLEHLFPNIAQRHYTGFENVVTVARLLGLKEAQATRTVVRFARDMTMRDIETGNLILLGSKQTNPWDSLFEGKLNFRFEYDGAAHKVFIVNRAPQPGEEAKYLPSALDSLERVIYGGIALLPNLNHGSNVLILQGTSMAGLEVALEFLNNPELFQDLERRVRGARKDRNLPYFEALIRTRTVNGVAGESSIVGCRVVGE